MKYNIEKMRASMEKSTKSDRPSDSKSKNNYWKPGLGEHEVRFAPYSTSEGHPILTLQYYDKLQKDKRFLAPLTFGMEDVVQKEFDKKRREKDGWNYAKNLKPREKFLAIVLVRGQEDKGWQFWEMKSDEREQLYADIFHKDWSDVDLFDPTEGRDYTVLVSQEMEGGKPKTFNGYPCKKIQLKMRAKATPIHKDKKELAKFVETVPDIETIFKAYVPSPEDLQEALQNYRETFSANSGVGSNMPSSRVELAMPKQQAGKLSKEQEDLLGSVFDDAENE